MYVLNIQIYKAFGKISDGTFISGLKHAVILTVTGYTLFVLLA